VTTRDEAIAQGRREGIPPGDAGAMFDRLAELSAKVAAGEITREQMESSMSAYAKALAQARKLCALMSPNLNVLDPKA
jgi:hypothetical protein